MTWWLAAGVAALLTACGSSSPGHPQTSLAALCTKLGGTFSEESEAPHDLWTSDEGRCGRYRFELFTSKSLRDRWLTGARSFGGNFVVGPDWVATCDNPADAVTARRVLGGGA